MALVGSTLEGGGAKILQISNNQYTFIIFHKQLVYKQLGLECEKYKQLSGLKHENLNNLLTSN